MESKLVSAVIDELPTQSPSRKLNDEPNRPKVPEDEITKALGADEYIADHRFDWSREKLIHIGGQGFDEGPRFTYSRYYRVQRVIVDLITYDTDKSRALVKLKQDSIFEYNTEHKDAKIGYLPILPYQRVTRLHFESATHGNILNLPDRIVDPRQQLERGYVAKG
jgi:hypothetical protein